MRTRHVYLVTTGPDTTVYGSSRRALSHALRIECHEVTERSLRSWRWKLHFEKFIHIKPYSTDDPRDPGTYVEKQEIL